MYIERFFVPGLAHASYLIASEGEAVVIDPERDVSRYVDYLAQNKLKLIGIGMESRSFGWRNQPSIAPTASGDWTILSKCTSDTLMWHWISQFDRSEPP